jgi:hypothetical protein
VQPTQHRDKPSSPPLQRQGRYVEGPSHGKGQRAELGPQDAPLLDLPGETFRSRRNPARTRSQPPTTGDEREKQRPLEPRRPVTAGKRAARERSIASWGGVPARAKQWEERPAAAGVARALAAAPSDGGRGGRDVGGCGGWVLGFRPGCSGGAAWGRFNAMFFSSLHL